MRITPFFPALFLLGASCLFGQNFDTSGTARANGQYFYRYVVFLTDSNSGSIQESCSVTGTMTFDGKGSYATSNTQLYDSAGANGSCSNPTTGTYGIQSNGLAQLDNPVFPATLLGTFSSPVMSASSTEDGYYDFFVAIQASPSGVSAAALSGQYTAGAMDFLNSQLTFARQGYFTFTADGAGNISAFPITGSAYNLGSASMTQNVPGATYSLTGNGAGTLAFTSASGATPQSQLVSGSKALFISADGNYILGGSTTGTDMIFGFKASTGAISNSSLNGTYFLSGLDAFLTSSSLSMDAFYGSLNSNGDGIEYWSERFNDVSNAVTYDYTFNNSVSLNSSGIFNDGTYTTLVGNNGQAILLMGSGAQFSLNIGVRAPAASSSSPVWINPTGIVNAANYTPITTSYAPGELVSIFGQFGVQAQGASSLPISTTLGGLQVLVNGIAAPVFYVSPGQLTAMIPYEISGQSFATFQVVSNGVTSNAVTLYVDLTSPGVYTSGQSGTGAGSVLHANFTPVTNASPAVPGETLQLFLNGLGTVTNQPADGAAASANPLSLFDTANNDISLFLDDSVDVAVQPNIQFAGLAPGYAGLYQINFVMPTRGLRNGSVYLAILTDQATTEMAQMAVGGYAASATSASSAPTQKRLPRRK